jgi:uncharacterized protein (DUF2132 family)
MTDDQTKTQQDPLHGVKLEAMLNYLVEHIGWAGMAGQVKVNCFRSDPTIKSSLKFLRRTPWARDKVEALYLELVTNEKVTRPPLALRQKKDEAADPWAKHTQDDQ